MIVRFYLGPYDENGVEYGFGDTRVPVEGETIVADGSDPLLPKGQYGVLRVTWEVGIRGPKRASVALQRFC